MHMRTFYFLLLARLVLFSAECSTESHIHAFLLVELKNLNDFEFIHNLFPNEFWDFVQLMHFILYKEKQNGKTSYSLKDYARMIMKRFIQIKRKRFLSTTKDELTFLKNEICNGTLLPHYTYFNATPYCIEYKEIDCNDLTIEWCDKCKVEEGCFGSYFRKYHAPPLILVERHINQRNLINYVIMHEFDQGKIIAQAPVRIMETDTLDSLSQKIHAAEHVLFPSVILNLSYSLP